MNGVMSMKRILYFLIAISILLNARSIYEKDGFGNSPTKALDELSKQDISYQNRVHRVGLFWLNMTNFGMFGNPWGLSDPCTGRNAISILYFCKISAAF